MPSTIAFFPWVTIDEPLTVGSVRLFPYERGESPHHEPHASRSDIDGVLSAYALRKTRLISEATLMEVGNWHLGQDADEAVREQLFRAREFIAFAALAERRLFRGHFDYCNFDNYSFVVQNYQAGHTGAFSFSTRRRDGGMNQLWDTDEFTFLKPLHVASNVKVKLDQALLDALLRADEADNAPFAAIVEFNRANTDSQDVPIHTELVMTKSAFEFLLGIGHETNELVQALLPLVPERIPEARLEGPLVQRWTQARQRPDGPIRPLEAWAREFCIRRNEGAHGRHRRGVEHFVWSEHAHLAFTSTLFPLLVKQRLARYGFLEMDETDEIELAWVEGYLLHDPFDPVLAHQQLHEHPWNRTYSDDVLGEKIRRRLDEQMSGIDWKQIPAEGTSHTEEGATASCPSEGTPSDE